MSTSSSSALRTWAGRSRLHADDLLPEVGPLADLTQVTSPRSPEHRYRHHYALSERRIAALGDVLADGLARAVEHFQCPTVLSKDADPAASLCTWAATHGVHEVAAFAPTVGPEADLVPRLRHLLTSAGITLTLLRRASDAHACTGRRLVSFLGKDEPSLTPAKQPRRRTMKRLRRRHKFP